MKKLITNSSRPRYDCILVWGHGIKYLKNILKDIRDNTGFNIIKIERYYPDNIKKFVNQVYSFDYAPLIHLKEKTKYLKKTPKEVCFIFVKNIVPNDDYAGEGRYRHKESSSMKALKTTIRAKYNPRINGLLTEDHVIHATDCEEHVDQLLRMIGYKEGIGIFKRKTYGFELPYYLNCTAQYELRKVDVGDLYCSVVQGSLRDYITQIMALDKSPQYRAIQEGMHVYEEYIDKYIGRALQADYSVEKFKTLIEKFDQHKMLDSGAYVLVKNMNSKLVVVDGLHRVSVMLSRGIKKTTVCIVNE